MKARTAAAIGLFVLGSAGAAWWAWGRDTQEVSWRTVQVSREDVRKIVTATGTLDAVLTVDVGTQVSGILSEILVDFNDKVVEGQLLARIDPALLEADVASAAARLAEAEAGGKQRKLEYDRVARLHEREAATDQELESARAEHAVVAAQVRSAEVALARARRNLGYTTIASPIDGTVIERAVDPGQTVNAGLSAPTLFVLAGDLAHMQILVAVDESDIGQIREAQAAEFTVQAWPDRTFTGVVKQVRLQSTAAESVVTYTVVVSVENPDGVLLPGMTASVEFIVAEAPDALCVPNAALRYRPEEGTVVQADPVAEAPSVGGGATAGTATVGTGPGAGARGGGGRGGGAGGGRGGGASSALYLPEGNAVRRVTVTTGLRGATCTQVSGDNVVEGLTAVVGVERGDKKGAASTSPLQPASTGGRRRPGGF